MYYNLNNNEEDFKNWNSFLQFYINELIKTKEIKDKKSLISYLISLQDSVKFLRKIIVLHIKT